MDDDQTKGLREFGIIKALMKGGVAATEHGKQRNVIVEYQDGRNALLHMKVDINNPFPKLDEVERITFFIGDKEYEFVACQ
jgi:hypothetical protein